MDRVFRYAGARDRLCGIMAAMAVGWAAMAVVLLTYGPGSLAVFPGVVAVLMGTYACVRPRLFRHHIEHDRVRLTDEALEVRWTPWAPVTIATRRVVSVWLARPMMKHQLRHGWRLVVDYQDGLLKLGSEADLDDQAGLLADIVSVCGLERARPTWFRPVRYVRRVGQAR